MYEPHVTLAFKKAYFKLLWKHEGEWIHATCQNKFRSKNDITIWLVRYWQMLNGDFYPRAANFGEFYEVNNFLKKKKLKIKRGRKAICINDSDHDASIDFLETRKKIAKFFDEILGRDSCFEKGGE